MEKSDKVNLIIDFLETNKGKLMKVGIHAFAIGSYFILECWDYSHYEGYSIEIGDDNNQVDIIYNDEDIEKIETNSEYMDVFPNHGDIEIHTKYATVCFEIVK